MLGFFVFLGVLLLVAAIAAAVLKFGFVREKDEIIGEGTIYQETRKASPKALQRFASIKVAVLLTGLAIPLLLMNSLFFNAQQGYNYYVQYPTGQTTSHTSAIGLTWKGFGTVIEIKDFFTVSTDEGGSAHIPLIDIAFADKEVAKQAITYRVEIPQDKEGFEALVKQYRSQENLVRALTPKISEVVSNTAFMYTGQGYASGEAPAYNQAVRDQLKNGAYVLETKKESNTTSRRVVGDSLTIIPGQSGPVLKSYPKKVNGKIVREKLSYMMIGVTINDISLKKADFSKAFDTRMNLQRQQSADFQNSILERKTIVEQTKLEAAKGEKLKTIERLKQEKAAVQKIIAEQTKLQKDSIALQRSRILNETASIEAKTLRIKKDALAYANRQLVNAGLTPQERAEWEYKTAIGVAAEIAKMKVPTTVITGGENGNMSTEALLQLQILNSLNK